MMATGRRVLVVSHGEPALAVLRDQLPEGVRDLAISITATEREGFRQLEAGLRLLQAILSELKPGEQRRVIRDLEATIVGERARLAAIDREIEGHALAQLSPSPAATRTRPTSPAGSPRRAGSPRLVHGPAPKLRRRVRPAALRHRCPARRPRRARRSPGAPRRRPPLSRRPPGRRRSGAPASRSVRAAELRERAGEDDALLVRIRTPDELALAENALSALADLRRARRLVGAEPWLEPIAAAALAARTQAGSGPRCAASSPMLGPCSTSAGASSPAPSKPRSTSFPPRKRWPLSTLSRRATNPFGVLSFAAAKARRGHHRGFPRRRARPGRRAGLGACPRLRRLARALAEPRPALGGAGRRARRAGDDDRLGPGSGGGARAAGDGHDIPAPGHEHPWRRAPHPGARPGDGPLLVGEPGPPGRGRGDLRRRRRGVPPVRRVGRDRAAPGPVPARERPLRPACPQPPPRGRRPRRPRRRQGRRALEHLSGADRRPQPQPGAFRRPALGRREGRGGRRSGLGEAPSVRAGDGGRRSAPPRRLERGLGLGRLLPPPAGHRRPRAAGGTGRGARDARRRDPPEFRAPGPRAHLLRACRHHDGAGPLRPDDVRDRAAPHRQGHGAKRAPAPPRRPRRHGAVLRRHPLLDHAVLARRRAASRRPRLLRPRGHGRGLAIRHPRDLLPFCAARRSWWSATTSRSAPPRPSSRTPRSIGWSTASSRASRSRRCCCRAPRSTTSPR